MNNLPPIIEKIIHTHFPPPPANIVFHHKSGYDLMVEEFDKDSDIAISIHADPGDGEKRDGLMFYLNHKDAERLRDFLTEQLKTIQPW